ncbi:helix-turn-helix domain-containing protein [Bordetella sp. LUAb4]|uniref:helix-turn-helix domain-containing protein n=1 Tax=Bordetella sp. LUAb4 TaxID=2843195 RepID=UPI001E48713D|nr:helix-turn-helix domain-containing protein [Bordetella sp. LUAb4]
MVLPQDSHLERTDDEHQAVPAVVSQHALAENPGSDNLDPALAALLQAFWDTHQEAPGKRLSLARLSKRADLPMSTLRRTLTQLEDGGLVTVSIDEDGTGSAMPTPELLGLIEDLLG